jgi:hypothetical protein
LWEISVVEELVKAQEVKLPGTNLLGTEENHKIL